jgi:hypothetical protein
MAVEFMGPSLGRGCCNGIPQSVLRSPLLSGSQGGTRDPPSATDPGRNCFRVRMISEQLLGSEKILEGKTKTQGKGSAFF